MNSNDPYPPPESNPQSNKSVITKRPSFVTLGIILVMLMSLTGSITAFFSMDVLTEQLAREGNIAARDPSIAGVMETIIIGSTIFGLLMNGLFCWFISQGKNWARMIMLVLIGLGLLFALPGLFTTFGISALLGIWNSVQNLITLVALVCLFMPISNLWFKAVKES